MTKEDDFSKLEKEILSCKKCRLSSSRTHALVGTGSIFKKILIIGEAPGKEEDLHQKAFIGAAGKILDEMLKEAPLKRENVYITNIVKCRPPKNRDPSLDEIHMCENYLIRQIKLIQPQVILTLGRVASKMFFSLIKKPFSSISKMHGKKITFKSSYGEVDLICMYHPAMGLYGDKNKKILLEDMQKHKSFLKKFI